MLASFIVPTRVRRRLLRVARADSHSPQAETHVFPFSTTRRSSDLAQQTTTRLPVVLCHGLLGFEHILGADHAAKLAAVQSLVRRVRRDAVVALPRDLHYFSGIAPRLRERHGVERVMISQVSKTRGLDERAAQLHDFVEAQVVDASGSRWKAYGTGRVLPVSERRVNLVCHSMGGLDARYVVSLLGGSDMVASVTTIGTPHRGTYLADWGVDTIGEKLGVTRLTDFLNVSTQAFHDLRTDRMADFNRTALDHNDVRYFSFASMRRPEHTVLYPLAKMLQEHEGDNDGLVSVQSALWSGAQPIFEADHLEQINWGWFNPYLARLLELTPSQPVPLSAPEPFDPLAFYDRHMDTLKMNGL